MGLHWMLRASSVCIRRGGCGGGGEGKGKEGVTDIQSNNVSFFSFSFSRLKI